VAAIQRVLSMTENCDLILENAAGQNGKIGSLEELSFLINTVANPRLKICLDTAHLFASGIDLRSPVSVKKLVSDLKEFNLLNSLVCLHVNDCASDLGSHRDLHANLGEGKIGLEGLKSLINHQELSHLPLILEVPGDNRQGPNLVNITTAKGLTF
jgi:deoxyribonuclease-4